MRKEVVAAFREHKEEPRGAGTAGSSAFIWTSPEVHDDSAGWSGGNSPAGTLASFSSTLPNVVARLPSTYSVEDATVSRKDYVDLWAATTLEPKPVPADQLAPVDDRQKAIDYLNRNRPWLSGRAGRTRR